jgi:hypothetical protein
MNNEDKTCDPSLVQNNVLDENLNYFYDVSKKMINNQEYGFSFLYDENDLIINSNFLAESNDVYVLDVTKPHSVKPQGKFEERVIVQLGTSTYGFNDVCNMLRETGNL